jgi:hypothetical protein
VGEQPGCGGAPRDGLRRERRLDNLRVVPGAFANPAGVARPYDLPDEQGSRSVVEPFRHIGTDPYAGPLAARTRLLGVGQVDLNRQQDGNDRLALVAWAAIFTCCLWSTKVGASAGKLNDVNDKKVAGTAFSRFK